MTVKAVVPPAITVAEAGVTVPPLPAVEVTVYSATKVAVTVQLAVTAPVVYVAAEATPGASAPPHPVTLLTA